MKEQSEEISQTYLGLVDQYTQTGKPGSFFRMSRALDQSYPDKGFKLHISASILNAVETLNVVAPYLLKKGIPFKVPSTIDNLILLNSGKSVDYCQVGKFITIYPDTSNPKVLSTLAANVHAITKNDLSAPVIPFDLVYRKDSRVYYRYGSYHSRDRKTSLAERTTLPPIPAGITDPIGLADDQPEDVGIFKKYPVYESVSQRGKGCVYRGIDISGDGFQMVVIKEGKKNGETDWQGNDGFSYRAHEKSLLELLLSHQVNVPEIVDFCEDHDANYLILKDCGRSLRDLIKRREFERNILVEILKTVAAEISKMHALGIQWYDCKSANILIDENGEVYLSDFEMVHDSSKSCQFAFSTFQYAHKHQSFGMADKVDFLIICYEALTGNLLKKEKLEIADLEIIRDELSDFNMLYDKLVKIATDQKTEIIFEDIIKMFDKSTDCLTAVQF